MPLRRFVSVLCLIAMLGLLPACSTLSGWFHKDKDQEEQTITKKTDKELYQEGLDNTEKNLYKTAIENFQEIERLYPFSKLATKAEVMIAYAHYKNEDYDDSISAIDRYVRLHPGHEDVAYMYYLRAMNFYERIADVKRDQKVTLDALDALGEVIRRFPDSTYARDAKLKLDLVNDHLAGKIMEIGRFYMRQRKFISAINRFKEVVAKHDTTSHAPEALYRLTECYLSIGLMEEAKKNASVLGYNYPNSKWYQYAYRLVAEGRDSPKQLTAINWVDHFMPFAGKSDETVKPLPKDESSDSYWQKIKNVF